MKNNPDQISQIRNHCRTLKLQTMEKIFDDELSKALHDHLPLCTVLDNLLGSEARAVVQRRIERRIKESRLPDRKLLTYFDFAFQTGLDKTQILELTTLSFVQRKQSVILAGASGTGKSHIVNPPGGFFLNINNAPA